MGKIEGERKNPSQAECILMTRSEEMKSSSFNHAPIVFLVIFLPRRVVISCFTLGRDLGVDYCVRDACGEKQGNVIRHDK